MSIFARSGLTRSVTALTGAAAITVGMFAAAPAASANDFDRNSAEVIAQIEAQAWPHYTLGDINIDVRAAHRILGQDGYDTDEETSEFTDGLEEQIEAYQTDNEQFLPVTGELDKETWLLLRERVFGDEYVPGDGPDTERTLGVLAVQEILQVKRDSDINNDGWYGEETFFAVCEAQNHYGIEEDGFVGRLTWRALVTDQDYDQDAAVALEDAEVPETAADVDDYPTDLNQEEMVQQYDCANRPTD